MEKALLPRCVYFPANRAESWDQSRKHWKRRAGKIPQNDLRNRKSEFFPEAADPLETFAVLLMIEHLSHAMAGRELI